MITLHRSGNSTLCWISRIQRLSDSQKKLLSPLIENSHRKISLNKSPPIMNQILQALNILKKSP